MEELAEHLCQMADAQAVSPVVIAQPGLRLRPPFYVSLASALLEVAGRDVDLELVTELDGWTSGVQRLSLRRLATRLTQWTESRVHVRQVGVVSRPAGRLRPLVVGIACTDFSLPPWAEAVHVCTRPTESSDFQLIGV